MNIRRGVSGKKYPRVKGISRNCRHPWWYNCFDKIQNIVREMRFRIISVVQKYEIWNVCGLVYSSSSWRELLRPQLTRVSWVWEYEERGESADYVRLAPLKLIIARFDTAWVNKRWKFRITLRTCRTRVNSFILGGVSTMWQEKDLSRKN